VAFVMKPRTLLLWVAIAGAAPIGCAVHGVSATDGGSADAAAPQPSAGDRGETGDAGKDAGATTPQVTCAVSVDQTGFVGRRTFPVGPDIRAYDLYVADHYDPATRLPVILVLHGDDGSAVQIRSETQFETAVGGDATIVYADGQSGTWDTATPPAQNRDFAMFDALLTDLGTRLCFDAERVFVWGVSRGAFMANQLGCYRGETLRGIIAQSGTGPASTNPNDYDAFGTFIGCTSPPPAAMVLHGDQDTVLPYSEGVQSAGYWSRVNGCTSASTPAVPSPCVDYNGCTKVTGWCGLTGFAHGVWSYSEEATWHFMQTVAP
jgi:polyhydroxybutyrate depolymerase